MADAYNKGQTVLLTATIEDPTTSVPTNDPNGEVFTVTRPDGTVASTTTVQHPSTGIYQTTVTVDQPGWWHVNDTEGGYYTFWVKPTVP